MTSASMAMPLVISIDGVAVQVLSHDEYAIARHYYFWFFGYVVKLPYQAMVQRMSYKEMLEYLQNMPTD